MNAPAKIEPVAMPGLARPAAVPAPRGRRALASLLLVVVLPIAAAAICLVTLAADQYESIAGFSVRREEAPGPMDLFGGFSGLSASGSSDPDVLYAFLTSQELVAAVDRAVDLRALWSRPADRDFIFGFDPTGTIEDLVHHWNRMVQISHGTGTGILTLKVRAFDPFEAQAIAAAAFEEPALLINGLSAIARDDIVKDAQRILEEAESRLRSARQALTSFRTRTQIVDPGADVSGQMGLLVRLLEELADELIRLDLLRNQTRKDDPRIAHSLQRIDVIEARIAMERKKFGSGATPSLGNDYATVMAEYERLSIDVEFAEKSVLAARVAYDEAVADARRRTRYLAAHIRPTLAERATAPDPVVILGLGGLILTLVWSVLALGWASLRERN